MVSCSHTHMHPLAHLGQGRGWVGQQKGKHGLQGLDDLRRTQSTFSDQVIAPLCPWEASVPASLPEAWIPSE